MSKFRAVLMRDGTVCVRTHAHPTLATHWMHEVTPVTSPEATEAALAGLKEVHPTPFTEFIQYDRVPYSIFSLLFTDHEKVLRT